MSKASRFNRQMMTGMGFFAIILFGCVFAMLYYSFQNVSDKRIINDYYAITFDNSICNDSVAVAVNDSILFSGIAADSVFIRADGNTEQNMLSVTDLTDSCTLNTDLPLEPSSVRIFNDGKLRIETTKVLAPH